MCLNFFSVVEPPWVLVTNGSFHSDICVSPLTTSPAPLFTGTLENNVTFKFNDAEFNEFYRASIRRNITAEGHHRASLIIIIDGANYLMFSNAIITCWVNLDVILQYRLIIGNFPTFIGLSDFITVLAKIVRLHYMIIILYIAAESNINPTTDVEKDTDAATMATSDGNTFMKIYA